MQNRAIGIVRKINRKSKSLDILTAPTHERYQGNLATLPHTFWMVQHKSFKPWVTQYGPVPKNHILIQHRDNPINPNMKFDLVLSQNKFGQIQTFQQATQRMNIPMISLEHTWPMGEWTDKYIDKIKSMRGDLNVFISEASAKAWGWSLDDPSVRVLHHGVDTNLFVPDDIDRDNRVLTVANDYINRNNCLGFDIYQRVTENFLTFPVGDTEGFSNSLDRESLIKVYQKSGVFLNTSTESPIPMSVLESMSCGCCVVSTATCALPEIIENGVNGWCSNDEEYLKDKLKWALTHPREAREMGQKARETMLERFSLEVHLENWESLLQEAYSI